MNCDQLTFGVKCYKFRQQNNFYEYKNDWSVFSKIKLKLPSFIRTTNYKRINHQNLIGMDNLNKISGGIENTY